MENIKLNYKISPEEYLEAYDIFYLKKKRKSKIVMAALFAVALLLFIQQVYIDPYYTMGWVCIAISVGAIICIFANAKVERRSYERAVQALLEDTYEMTLTKEQMTVSTVLPESDEKYLETDSDGNTVAHPTIPPTVLDIKDRSFRAYETENIFCVMDKNVVMSVPKSKMTKYDIENLRDALKPEGITLKNDKKTENRSE